MQVIFQDALEVGPAQLADYFSRFDEGAEDKVRQQQLATRKLQIVGNLPFNVSCVLATRWLKWMATHTAATNTSTRCRTECHERNEMGERAAVDMLLVFQKEVADRLVAQPGKDMSRLTLLSQYVCHTKIVEVLPSSVFVPEPKVRRTTSVEEEMPP
jgi:16S rRNA A1518/A1519 N6-dimethyltransferase RsmA/KsgA/DIM1 with predicted DNA glycosylase/AP lyase activity